jgi:hypothetical protein
MKVDARLEEERFATASRCTVVVAFEGDDHLYRQIIVAATAEFPTAARSAALRAARAAFVDALAAVEALERQDEA